MQLAFTSYDALHGFKPGVRACHEGRLAIMRAAEADSGFREVEAVAGGLRYAGRLPHWAQLLAQMEPVSVTIQRGAEPAAVMETQVEVDTRLEKIEPRGPWQGVAAGRIFLPTLARGQVEDGIIQGVGYALYTVGVAAYVGNAVYNATGWGPLKTPITSHDVPEGMPAETAA